MSEAERVGVSDRHDKRADTATEIVRAAKRWACSGGPVWRLGRHSVYRLPWYVMIGDEGAGKSTLLRASGRRPAQRAAVAGNGSSVAFAGWWFGEGSLVFEATASEAAEEESLRALMLRLKRARRRRPIDGLLVTVSARQLLDEDDLSGGRRADMMRARIEMVYRTVGRRVPVYLTVSRCDHIGGFEAFALGLEDATLDAPLGVLLPVSAAPIDEAWAALFLKAFESLVCGAQAQLIERLPAYADSRHAADVYQFPQSLRALSLPLTRFLHDAFGAAPNLCEPVLLRGVNLSAVLSKEPDTAKNHARLSPTPDPRVRPCFVRGWFNGVLASERDLARSHWTMSAARVLRMRVAATLCVALTLSVGWAITSAYRHGASALAATASSALALARVSQQPVDAGAPRTMLPVLDAAAALNCGPQWREGKSAWSSALSFDGPAHLQSACREAYLTVQRETIEPYLLARLSQILQDDHATQAARYDALRVYLMLGDKTRYEPAVVRAWVRADAAAAALAAREHTGWLTHASAWADAAGNGPNLPTDPSLIARARERLVTQPEAQRIFAAITTALAAAMPIPLSVADMAGPGAVLVFGRRSGGALSEGIPGAYTVMGMHRYGALRDAAIAQARRDEWVLGPRDAAQATAANLAAQVDQLYFARYAAAWDKLIDDIRLLPPAPGDDGAATVKLLAGRESPLRALVLRAAQETSIDSARVAPGVPLKEGWLATVRRAMGRWSGASKQSISTSMALASSIKLDNEAVQAVDGHFEALHRLVVAEGATSASPLDQAQAQLREVAVYLQAASVARANGLPEPADDALQHLMQSAAVLPAPLGRMLEGLGEAGSAAAQSAERSRIDARWRSDVAPFCHAAIDGRYPFSADAGLDVTLDDFTRLFAPGGLLDAFFQSNLKPYVDMTATPWRWRAAAAATGMSTVTLSAFERAARIRDALFPNQDKAMTLRFTLTPQRIDPAFTFFVFTWGDQTVNLAQRPPQATPFEWSRKAAQTGARIDYIAAGDTGPASIETHGVWSLFRLLDRGRLEAVTPDHFTLTFSIDTRQAELGLAASSVVNPFVLPALHAFRCPSGI